MATPFRPTTLDRITPLEPGEPNGPLDPVRPIDPIDPPDPFQPVDPIKPVIPIEPLQPLNPRDGTIFRRPILVPRENGSGGSGWLNDRLADMLTNDSIDAISAGRIASEAEAILAARGTTVIDSTSLIELANRLQTIRDLTEIEFVVDELLTNPITPVQPPTVGPFGTIVSTLFEIYEAAGITDPGLEVIWHGVTEVAVTQTAAVLQAEVTDMVNDLSAALELSPLQRQQMGQTVRADLLANEFYADATPQIGAAMGRFTQQQGNDDFNVADKLNGALYEGFLRGTEGFNGSEQPGGIPFGPGLEGLQGIIIAEGDQIFVKVGGFDLLKNLKAGNDMQPPVHLIEQRGELSDELSAVATTYQILPTVELYATEVRRRSDVDSDYPDPDLTDPIQPKYFVKVPPNLSIETHSVKLTSDAALFRTSETKLRKAITQSTEKLNDKAPDWKEKAKNAVNKALQNGAPGLGELAEPIVDGLINAFGDYVLEIAQNAGGRGIPFPELVQVHVTIYPKKGQVQLEGVDNMTQSSVPLNLVAAHRVDKTSANLQGMNKTPEVRKATPIPFTRIKGPKDDPIYDDEVGYKQERFLCWWVGASAITDPFERDYNNLTSSKPSEVIDDFKAAPQALLWREPMQVTDDTVADALKKNGVVIEKRKSGGSTTSYAYKGVGGIYRLDIDIRSSAWVALRAETFLIASDAEFLPDPTSPGFPG